MKITTECLYCGDTVTSTDWRPPQTVQSTFKCTVCGDTQCKVRVAEDVYGYEDKDV